MTETKVKKNIEVMLEEYAQTADNLPEKIDAALAICTFYRSDSVYDKGLKFAEIAREKAKKLNYKHGQAKALQELGLINFKLLNFDKALEYYFSSLNLFKTLSENEAISYTLSRIGVIYNALGLPVKALEYYLQSLEFNPENYYSLNNSAERYWENGDKEKALEFFNKAIEVAQKFKDRSTLAYIYKNLGEAYTELGQTDTAINYLDKSQKISKEIGDVEIEAFALLGIGSVSLKINNIEKAEKCCLQALKIAEKVKSTELHWFCYKQLSDVYEQIGDDKSVVRYLKLSMKLHEQMYSENVTRRIAELEAAYEMEKRELEAKRMMEKSARLASIGVMAAGITHEINQPLNVITINADGLLYKDDHEKVLPQDYRDSINQIFDAATRIDDIVKHMRSFWAIPDYDRLQSIELNLAIKHALSLISRQVVSHGILLKTDFFTQPAFILGNNVHIEQIIINLTINAIHSLDKISNRQKEILIRTTKDEEHITLQVADNGEGLPTGIDEKLYDPFFSTRKAGEGMGLGLAIVKNYIEEMKGTITHQNRPEGGAEFSIVIPLDNTKDNGINK